MYHTILVPVDLAESGYSDKAVEEALGILAPHGRLVLLTVVPGYQMPLVGSFFPSGTFDHVVKEARTQLETFVSEKLSIDPEECTLIVEEGKPADTILEVAHRLKADIIVMASHKQNPVERTVIGTIAAKVSGRADVPVLVVKR